MQTTLQLAWAAAEPAERDRLLNQFHREPPTLREAWLNATVEQRRDLVREWFAIAFAEGRPGGM